MNFKKTAIVMTIVPALFISACSSDPSPEQVAQEKAEQLAVDGANAMNKSYEEAKAQGYTGTLEEWVALVKLNQTDPAAAQKQAESAGFSGMEMLMAGAMGMMIGNMLGNAMASKSYSSNYYDKDRRSYATGGTVATRSAPTSSSYRSNSSKSSSSMSSSSRGGFGGAVSSGG